jgi:alkylation response protein AidB-like acyl-CoA dehydrogenase
LSAERRGDEFVLDGTKIWTSYASWAEFCFVLARTDPASRGGRGISIFLVPTATPGLTIEPLQTMLDVHVVHRLTFVDVVVPQSSMLGAEGEGWSVIREALAHERIGGPRYARSEMVLDQVQMMCEQDGAWGSNETRSQFGRARAAIEAARLLAYNVIDDRVKGRPSGPIVNIARVAMVRAERAVADIALDWSGERSLQLGSTANSQLKTSMIAGLGGGSVEVQLDLIARALFDAEGA